LDFSYRHFYIFLYCVNYNDGILSTKTLFEMIVACLYFQTQELSEKYKMIELYEK